ncbi:MAG: WbqC family protein [Bacteroidales bacterium]|nr:WbqC family protein [Bacteroidales bacterium]
MINQVSNNEGIKLAAHQPNFIPWCGYFYKIALSDVFVIADDVSFTNKSYINRNKIKTPEGPKWLTLPVEKAPLGTAVSKIKIFEPKTSFKRVINLLKHNYSRTEYFDHYILDFNKILTNSGDLLADINLSLIRYIMRCLEIETHIVKLSDIEYVNAEATQRIISICKSQGADTYISGYGGKKYQSEELMKANGIDCQIYEFIHPIYKQLWGAFEPKMSIIDLMFNCGPEAARILRNI